MTEADRDREIGALYRRRKELQEQVVSTRAYLQRIADDSGQLQEAITLLKKGERTKTDWFDKADFNDLAERVQHIRDSVLALEINRKMLAEIDEQLAQV